MSALLDAAGWSAPRLASALELLSRRAGLHPVLVARPPPPPSGGEGWASFESWRVAATAAHRIEAEPIQLRHAEAAGFLERGGPALLSVTEAGQRMFLALVRSRGRRALLLRPDGREQWVRREELRELLCAELEALEQPAVDRLLEQAGVPSTRRPQARRALLGQRLAKRRVAEAWLLRLPQTRTLWELGGAFGVRGAALTVAVTHLAQFAVLALSWWILGRGVLAGQLDRGRWMAWALLLATGVVLRSVELAATGRAGLSMGTLLRRRLLEAGLRLDPDEVRSKGAGQLLCRVLESQTIEALATSGGLTSLLAGVELFVAAFVLLQGTGGGLQLVLLIAWIGIALSLAWHHRRGVRTWMVSRLSLTDELVEGMSGHKTRICQQPVAQWHAGEDDALRLHLECTRQLDRSQVRLMTAIPRGWLLLSLLGLAPVLVWHRPTIASIAVAVGGMLLAHQAFSRLAQGLSEWVSAHEAWAQLSPLFRPAERSVVMGDSTRVPSEDSQRGSELQLREISYRYRKGGRRVLEACDLTVRSGDRILLEGASGSGKSTLAAVLAGLRRPTGGILLLDGLDPATYGHAGWRKRIALAPQTHENHVLTGTLAFNLLLGRSWPPEPADLADATAVCEELGLGPLVSRMPSGLMEMVGESGWQLSHGERSRVFLARALLQRPHVVIVDESFAALDPVSARMSLACAEARAPALVVVAHR